MPDIVLDKAKNALAAFIKAVMGGAIVAGNVDLLAFYACTVVAQNGDGTSTQSGSLELKPDDSRLGPAFSHVPLRLGIPGCVVTLGTPTRCLLSWYGGERTKPFAALFENSLVTKMSFAGTELDFGGNTDFMIKGTSFFGHLNTFVGAVQTLASSLAAATTVANVSAAGTAFGVTGTTFNGQLNGDLSAIAKVT